MKSLESHLENELKKHLKNSNEKLETVFLGGGTPSCIKSEKYEKIFDILQPYLHENCEITTEANPNSATYEWLKTMKSHGVNRVSFGVQSFDNEKLKFLGRAHNKTTAIQAIENARKLDFDSVNCDIIYGVQNDTFESLKKDYDTIKSLNIEHLSSYSLTIEEDTKFFLQEKSRQKNHPSIKIDDEDLSYKIFDYLEHLSYKQYEISNFAKNEHFQSKHNFGYWQHKNYLGIGAGAVGFIDNQRYYPKKDLHAYIQNPQNYDIEQLTPEDIKVEKVLLGFRCSLGVEKTLFNQKEFLKVQQLINNNKLTQNETNIFNPNFLLADELALYVLD